MTKLAELQLSSQSSTKLVVVANRNTTVTVLNKAKAKTAKTTTVATVLKARAHKATATAVAKVATVATTLAVHAQASVAKVLHQTKVHCSQTSVRQNLVTSALRHKASQRQWFRTLKLLNLKVQKTYVVTNTR